jgi:hypothetical protein
VAAATYFVFVNGEVAGPYTPGDIRSWRLDPATQVCAVGTEEWRLLSQVGELLPPPSAVAVARSPLMAAEASSIEITDKKKIFIIHGRGNTMDNAFRLLIPLIRVKIRYYHADFYVDAENSGFVRYILNESHDGPWVRIFDRVLTGKIVIAPFYPPPGDWTPDATWTKLSDYKISAKFEHYGVPVSEGGTRRAWCDQHFARIWDDAFALLGVPINSQPALAQALSELRMSLRPPDGGMWLESEYKDAIRAHFSPRGIDPEPFIGLLLEFQRLNDAGGDLDTIASNALYGAWTMQAWQAKYGRLPRYGRDFEFDFVNYHQSFLHLARHKNCEIYLPDFPMDAIPDLEEAAKAIIEAGSYLVRIDDHHPMGREKMDLLERLKAEGFFGDFVMSGPVKGTEQANEEKTCGADLVHREMLARRGFDSPGLEELRRLAHQQDLHLIEDPDDRAHPDYLAIDLSKLIGSKHSRIDMAQQLMQARTFEEMRGIMDSTGWRRIVDEYEETLERVLPKLDACMARIEFVDPADLERARGQLGWIAKVGPILKLVTFGSVDLVADALRKRSPEFVHRIHMTLAPFQSRKEPRVNVASAIGYMKRFFRFDYFFYAWGSSLLTTRRYNDKDQVLDLSQLMPIIGGPGDGGHSSAATCKPPSNPLWPKERFAKLKKDNFHDYANYIASRVEAGAGVRIVSVAMLTEADRDFAS